MASKYTVSVDMGGTKILASVLNTKEGIIARDKKPTNVEAGTSTYINDIIQLISSVIEKSGVKSSQIVSVSLGVPGSVNPLTGIIGLAPNLGLKNYNIKKALQKRINHPVLIENDVNLAALGIKHFGVGKKAKNILVVSVGTGIGGGIILNEKLYRGSKFVAGEIGHIPVEKNGPVCGCGRKGCFESVASRTAIVNRIFADIKAGRRCVLKDYVKSGKKIKSGALKNAIAKKDKVVLKRITEASETIGQVLAGLTNFLNFDMIVLAGGLIEAADNFMLPVIKSSFNKHVLKDSANGLKILPSKLADDAAIYGGIALTEEYLGIKI
ncbi:MAG: ROK family protein [Ignavibacterium sp.]|nr:ROK family protein [Ignavibacterium sp.]